MIKAITFDLDDTLWPILPVIIEAEKITKRWLIKNYPPLEIVLNEDVVLNIRKDLIYKDKSLINRLSELRTLSIKELAIRAGYQSNIASKIGKEAFLIFFEARNKVTFYEGVLDVLTSLKDKYIMGSLTNGNADLKKVGLNHLFNFHFSSSDLNSSKPDPKHFEAAIKSTNLLPGEICHIGDHPLHDVIGAKNAGLHSIWFNPENKEWTADKNKILQIKTWNELESIIESIT